MNHRIALLISGVALAAIVAGLGAGYLAFSDRANDGESTAAGGDGHTMYTCGMHPQVMSPVPGDCPQCGMKLTPIKVDGAGGSGGSGAGKKDREILYWVAPMDPSYVRDGPGKSPMGMDLVPVYADEVQGGATVKIDPVTEQNMGLRTAAVTKGPLVREIRAVGNVEYDERKIGEVTLKVGGYIEKLHVDETGVLVKKGDPLFDMYAPEVVQAQDEYLRTKATLETAEGDERERVRDLLEAARNKLLRWDLSEQQIRELEERGRPAKVMTWRSPLDGIVMLKNALEGAFVKAGEPLYRIGDLRTVWVMASIYEYEFPWVRVGQSARMELPYFPGETFSGTVDYVYPYLDPKTRDRRVRLVFDNPGFELVPDMYSTVVIEARLAEEAVLVPTEAVLETGERQLVFVAKGKGTFDPREIKAGVEARGGMREVLSGLKPGDRVVTSGQFLLDSESKIREAIQKMLRARAGLPEPEPKISEGAMEGMKKPAAEGAFVAPAGLTPIVGDVCPVMGGEPVPGVYVDYKGYRIFFCCSGCPARFEEDPEKYIEKLRRMGHEIRLDDAGAGKTVYTCPMHPEVRSEKPGECPKCGMDLVPEKKGTDEEGTDDR